MDNKTYTCEELAALVVEALEHVDTNTLLFIANECLDRRFKFAGDVEFDKFVEDEDYIY